MPKPRIAPQVETELDEIWFYIADHSGSIEIADRVIESITIRFLLLAQSRHLGRRRDDLRPGLRSFPVGNYIIFYRIEKDTVLILHVVHGSRDLEAFLKKS